MTIRFTAGMALAFAAFVPAQASEPQTQAERPACIEVEVNGQRVPAYDCLSEMLSAPADGESETTKARQDPRLASERVVAQPGNRIGLFNQAATQQRMGNAFGKSVRPQRPPTPPPTSPIVRKP